MHIFENRTIDDEFHRYGYAVVNLLDDAQVQELSAIYQRYPSPDIGMGFVVSTLIDDYGYNVAVDEAIRSVLESPLSTVIPDYRIFHASFVTKRPDMPSSAVAFHQDPTLVDEREHRNFTVWCPLVEVDARNGWLGVVAGSHRFNQGFRGGGMPYPDLQDLLNNQLVTFLPMRPGQVVFLDPRTFHCSPRNTTDQPRQVAAATVTSRACKNFYYCHRVREQGEHMMELFEVGDDFFLHHVLGRRPTHGRLHSVISAPPEPIDAQRMFEACSGLVRQPDDSAIVHGFRV